MAIQFEDILERYLRPKALNENLDHSSWRDKAQVWVRTNSSSPDDTLAFIQGTVIDQKEQTIQVKLFNGKVIQTTIIECLNLS